MVDWLELKLGFHLAGQLVAYWVLRKAAYSVASSVVVSGVRTVYLKVGWLAVALVVLLE